MELAEPERGAFVIAVAAEDSLDLPLAGDVADLLRRTRGGARGLAGCRFFIEAAAVHEVLDGLRERPASGLQIHVDADARRAITREPKDLRLSRRVVRIQTLAHQHLLAVQRPSFLEDTVALLAANLVLQMIGDRDLQEMPGDAFVSENRARVFDRRADVEVLAVRVVSRDEVEAAVVP